MGPIPIPYAKMNGIGNAILVADLRGGSSLDAAAARRLAGEGRFAFDQLMAVGPAHSAGADAYVDIFNADGSRAGACGNGTRCVAWFLLRGGARKAVVVETPAGRLACRRDADLVFTVDMGLPRFGWRDIPLREAVVDTRAVRLEPSSEWSEAIGPAAVVDMGNPHAVFWIDPARPAPDLALAGPWLECHPMFPDRANISFARVLAPDRIALSVWERGAGATLACGSAACATLVAAAREGLTGRRATIVLPGGELTIAWRETDDHVLMTGPVELEHEGVLPASLLDEAE